MSPGIDHLRHFYQRFLKRNKRHISQSPDIQTVEQQQLLLKDADKGFNGSVDNSVHRTSFSNSPPPPPLRQPGENYLNFGEDDQMEVYGYRRDIFRTVVTWTLMILTAFILRMVFHWFPEWYLKCCHIRCPLEEAEQVLVVELYQKKHRRIYIRRITTLNATEALTATDPPVHLNNQADHVMHTIGPNSTAFLCLPNKDGSFQEVESVRVFTCKKLRYFWDTVEREFRKIKTWGPGLPTSALHSPDAQQGHAGLSSEEQARRRIIYGPNYINVPVKTIVELLLLEVLNPFYVFQVVSVLIWVMIEYYYFSAAIVVMSAAGIVISIIQTRSNQKKLRSTVHGSDLVTVCRGGGLFETIRTEDLVPGDVIVIPPNGCSMYCDAVLLFGTCIVNESMLTGESVPVTKTPLPHRSDIIFHPKEHGRHTLFCGTKVVQTRFYDDEKVMAVVISTGYMTAKGSLVSAIMYPPPVDFRFERDSYRFIGFLAALASIGFTYSIVSKILDGETGKEIVFHSFDIITICVPPALPAAMTAGILMAQKRLEFHNIYCISPRSINVSGSLNCVCFDKTGTLTEDGLDLWGVVPVVSNGRCLPPIKNPSKMHQAFAAVRPISSLSSPMAVTTRPRIEPPLLLMGMATCHTLTIIDNVLSGDPLDLKMFESTGWSLVEPSNEDTSKYDNICPTVVTWKPVNSARNDDDQVDWNTDFTETDLIEVGIVRQFPFSSSLQRMGVICKRIGDEQLHFFSKGSPEMIQSLSKPETVPPNFDSVLEDYTRQGYRVIALAHRPVEFRSIVKLQKVQREELENNLTFLGLVILENRLKEDTASIIGQLRDADIRTVMVTGDNLLTAISVARDCGMVGLGDRVVIVNTEDSADLDPNSKPQIEYTLAENSALPVPDNTTGQTSPILNEEIVLDIDTNESGRYHLAVTGKTWSTIRNHYPELVTKFAVKGTVFARMSPDQKQQLVQELQKLSYYVGMCGDGANDCGGLKAAHAGIALSDSEASVASPFTSKDSSISCVPELIRQGRCALVTSFGIFKYMAAYSLTQFLSVMILYNIGTNLTDFQFLYIDLFLICSLSAVFGRTQPYPGPLHNKPPLMSLLSPPAIGSLVIQVFFIGLFQGLSLVVLQQQPWFQPYHELHNQSGLVTGEFACHENYAVFGVSMFQYIILALAYAKGRPYRKSFVTNYLFLGSLVVLTGISVYILIDPDYYFKSWLELEVPEDWSFRFIVLGLAGVQVVLCLLSEEFVVDLGLVSLMNSSFWLRLRPRKEKYLAVENELSGNNWPELKNRKTNGLSPPSIADTGLS